MHCKANRLSGHVRHARLGVLLLMLVFSLHRTAVGQVVECSERPEASPQPDFQVGMTDLDAIYMRMLSPVDGHKFPLKVALSVASPRRDLCCARGSIATWTIAYGEHPFYFLGKVSFTCYDGSESPAMIYGYNGTDTLPCFTNPGFHSEQTVADPPDGNYTVRIDLAMLEEFIAHNHFARARQQHFSCKEGEKAVGFAASRNCLSLTNIKVFCATVKEPTTGRQESSAGSGPSDEAGSQGKRLFTLLVAIMVFTVLLAVLGVAVRYIRQNLVIVDDFLPLPNEADIPEGVDLPLWYTPHSLCTAGVTEKEFVASESLPQMDESTFDKLPEFCQNWRIAPSSLKQLCHDDRPIVLGEGPLGKTVLAMYCGSKVAVKIVEPGSSQNQAQLLQELIILEQCKFSHIVQFYGFFIEREKLCLVMEYMDDKALSQRIQAHDRSVQWYQRGRSIMIDIALGLKFLHSKGIAHLNLKSANILLTSHAVAKISDVSSGKLDVSELPNDIYAFGDILWEVCTLQKRPLKSPLMALRVPQEAPQKIANMIAHCQSQDPADRPVIGEICDWLRFIGSGKSSCV